VNFIWCDLETNGLDPLKPDALILEIALVAVAIGLNEVAHWHSPIIPSVGNWFSTLPPELVEMHSNSGLLGELRGPRSVLRFEAGGLPTLAQAEEVAMQFMQAYGGEPKFTYIAGANPAFDLSWIRKHMPHLATRFSYRPFDSNAFHMASAWLSGAPMAKTGVRHRALDDCRQSIGVVRSFFGLNAPSV
jgi:oligoribonuclease (3'-5' exoribonuclease)